MRRKIESLTQTENNGRWRDVTLEDVATEITVGHVGPMASEYVQKGIPFLRSQNVEHLRINTEDMKFISQAFHERLHKSRLSPGDVVIVRTGEPGTCAVIPESLPVANCSDLAIVRCSDSLNPRFLAYFVNSMATQHVASHLVGAVQQHFNISSVRNIRLNLPPIDEQNAIVNVLGTLDDKIEVNRQMKKTLESMGQAIFKHWFIDFEFPNEEGKPYKSSDGEMVYNEELGKEIPKEWKAGSVLNCARVLSGGTPRTEVAEYWGGEIPWVSAKDVTSSQGSFIFDTERKITQLGVDNSNAKLLPRYTTVVTARGSVGSYCILPREMAINQTNYGLKTNLEAGDFFVFFSISNLVNQMKQRSYGTIFDTITTATFEEMRIPIPPIRLISSFEETTRNIMMKILANLQENCSLASIRDALLPKLMLGKIRVPVEVR